MIDAENLRRRLLAAYDQAGIEKAALALPEDEDITPDNLVTYAATAHFWGVQRGLEAALIALNIENDPETAWEGER